MNSFFDSLLTIFGVVWIAGAISGIWKARRLNAGRPWTFWGAGLLIVLGGLGFLGAGNIASGVIKPSESFECPAGSVSGVVQRQDGSYIVPLESLGRLQTYTRDWKFVRGWQVDAGGGNFKVAIVDPDFIEVFTARRRIHYTYTYSGVLVRSGPYSESFEEIPKSSAIRVPTPLLLWPFSSPFLSWLLIVIGIVVMKLLEKRHTSKTRNVQM